MNLLAPQLPKPEDAAAEASGHGEGASSHADVEASSPEGAGDGGAAASEGNGFTLENGQTVQASLNVASASSSAQWAKTQTASAQCVVPSVASGPNLPATTAAAAGRPAGSVSCLPPSLYRVVSHAAKVRRSATEEWGRILGVLQENAVVTGYGFGAWIRLVAWPKDIGLCIDPGEEAWCLLQDAKGKFLERIGPAKG